MTDVLLICSKDGLLKGFKASGHSGFAKKGYDIVCASESFLLRTAIELLENTEGLVANTDNSTRGYLALSVEPLLKSSLLEERLRCIADFLRCGIKSLSVEYPEYVQLREITE